MDVTDVDNYKPPSADSLTDLIKQLHRVFESDHINVEYVHELMLSYKSNPKEWQKYAKFDRHRYTRNLVDEGNGKFNLMILCWSEGQGSSIHDHADSHCFMKVLAGELKEVRFDWPMESEGPDCPMKMGEENQLPLNSVAYINDSLGLHRVENPSHCEQAVSLHLYCPPFDKCLMFDQRTGHKSVSKVTFWSKFGQRTPFTISSSEPIEYENN